MIQSHLALRGIAALMVVAYHLQFQGPHLPFEDATRLFRRGYLLVDFFFVLSGFIISFTQHGDRPTAMGLALYRRFMLRRLFRLYPLHIFCLTYLVLFMIGATAIAMARHQAVPAAWSAEGLAGLVAQYLLLNAWLPGGGGWNIPSWSISAEFFAYALFPLMVNGHLRRPRVALAVMAALSLGFYAIVGVTSGSLDIIGGWAPFRCLAGFLLGVLVYHGRLAIGRLGEVALTALQLLAAAAAVLLLCLAINDVLIMPAFVLLAATTWTDRGLLPWLLDRRPLRFLGEISYSIYLNHVCLAAIYAYGLARLAKHMALGPVALRLAQILPYLALVIAFSWLTYRFVERPWRQRLAERFLHRRLRPIAASPAAP